IFQDLLNALTLKDPRTRRPHYGRAAPTTVQQVQDECERLLDSDDEAGSISLASSVFDSYAALPDSDSRREFFLRLREHFDPDRARIDLAYAAYKDGGDDDSALQELLEACEPPRQELLRRLNLAPGGTRDLVRMRED